jgi:hypothetical protein
VSHFRRNKRDDLKCRYKFSLNAFRSCSQTTIFCRIEYLYRMRSCTALLANAGRRGVLLSFCYIWVFHIPHWLRYLDTQWTRPLSVKWCFSWLYYLKVKTRNLEWKPYSLFHVNTIFLACNCNGNKSTYFQWTCASYKTPPVDVVCHAALTGLEILPSRVLITTVAW